MNAWKADPHQFGAGKVHWLREDDNQRTLCGKYLEAVPGMVVRDAPDSSITCQICRNKLVSDGERTRREAEWQERARERERQRIEDNERWWTWYDEYLQSTEWRARRQAVLERANFTCQGCGTRRATQVHHLTYVHAGHEMLWELVAICEPCHELCTHGVNSNQ